MAIQEYDPNTIFIGGGGIAGGEGGCRVVGDRVAGVQITPGMLIEYYNDGGTLKWRPHSGADAKADPIVALELTYMNKTVDDPYLAGALVDAGHMAAGSLFWGILPSGQDISPGERLQSNGDGKLKTAGSGDGRFVALQSSGGVVTVDTRIVVEVD